MSSSEFDDYDSVDSDQTVSHLRTVEDVQNMLDSQARRLSNRIDAIVRISNKVSFSLSREAGTKIRELAEIEGVSLSQMCHNIIEEYIS